MKNNFICYVSIDDVAGALPPWSKAVNVPEKEDEVIVVLDEYMLMLPAGC